MNKSILYTRSLLIGGLLWAQVAWAQKVHYGMTAALGEREGLAQWSLSYQKGLPKGYKARLLQGEQVLATVSIPQKKVLGDSLLMLRLPLKNLQPGMAYELQLLNPDKQVCYRQYFRTLGGAASNEKVQVAISSCMHYERFYMTQLIPWEVDWDTHKALSLGDSLLGFPGLQVINRMNPQLWISNGDNVYYDHPRQVKNTPEMVQKWQRQLAMPRLKDMMTSTGVWWLKDDHDYRGDDADPYKARDPFPSHTLGLNFFRQMAPQNPADRLVADSKLEKALPKTLPYHTRRLNRLLQVWTLEGREFRSANAAPDTTGKSLWGAAQWAWLKKSLVESDAVFKVIVSPTPLVGPDDASKIDNHTNIGGFRHEGQAFFQFLKEAKLDTQQVVLISGDRHWAYHSIHPSGYHELGSGALVGRNSRLGRSPGDPKSTDPEAHIRQPYTAQQVEGSFLWLECQQAPGDKPRLTLTHYNEYGALRHKTEFVGPR